jgi:hypothetical protein
MGARPRVPVLPKLQTGLVKGRVDARGVTASDNIMASAQKTGSAHESNGHAARRGAVTSGTSYWSLTWTLRAPRALA